jgi:tetratricopeptide (TPR) repeat protein
MEEKVGIYHEVQFIIAGIIILIYFLIGLLFAKSKKDKFDLKSFASLGYVTSILVVLVLFYSPVQNLLMRTAKDGTSHELEFIIAGIIISIYFLIGLLFAKSNSDKFKLESFASLGYVFSILVVLVLFYSPVQNLLMRTAKEATTIQIFDAKIELPIVAIERKKNDIIDKAIGSEKEMLKDTTNNVKNIKYVMKYMNFDLDMMKCKKANAQIQGIRYDELISKISIYKKMLEEMEISILPYVKKLEFNTALKEFKRLDTTTDNDNRSTLPYYYTVFALLYSGVGDQDKCDQYFEEGINKFPSDPILLHFNAGLCMGKRRDLISAIHNTKLAMAILKNKINEFWDEHTYLGILLNQRILSVSDEEAVKTLNLFRSYYDESQKLKTPQDYHWLTTVTFNYWKYRLAYLYSLVRLEEETAKKYASEIENDMKNKKMLPEYIDAIGMVKLVFAKNMSDIKEAEKDFGRAKKETQENPEDSENYKIIKKRIDSHITMVKDILNQKW